MNGVVFYHNGIMEQYDKIYENLLVAECCSFVGCFINLKIASDIGLPIKEFFIYADDHEYTNRLSEVKKGYLDAESIIIHKMKENSIPEVYDVSEDRINRYFYNFRNVTFIYMRKSIIKGFFNSFIRWARTIKYILKYSKSKKLKRIFVITKGTFCGIFFRPKIEFVNKNEK